MLCIISYAINQLFLEQMSGRKLIAMGKYLLCLKIQYRNIFYKTDI